MKKLILFLLMLIPFFAHSQNGWVTSEIMKDSRIYSKRFLPDAGLLNRDNTTKAFYGMAELNGMADNIQFAWFGDNASKKVADGVAWHLSKAYSLIGTNDAAQTTYTSQPWVTGNIAPSEREGMKNVNGGVRYVTHPEIAFNATDTWSVTTVLNWNGNTSQSEYAGVLNGSIIVLGYDRVSTYSQSIVSQNIAYNFGALVGKCMVITLRSNGNETYSLYVNGIFINPSAVKTNSTNLSFSRLMSGRNGAIYSLGGKVYAHIIRSGALLQNQITAEYNFFRSIYPEIETVKIGTINIASSNLDVTSSANGTVIPDGSVTGTWTGGTAFWCYHTDLATGAIYGKLYNKTARDVIIANPPSGYHVSTEAELTALALYGGNALKKEGTDYWTSTGGTNSTGFTAIGGSSREADGTFNTLKNTATFWCADSDKVLVINYNSNTATITATTANKGHSIRLIKN